VRFEDRMKPARMLKLRSIDLSDLTLG